MSRSSSIKTISFFILLLVCIVALSLVSNRLWQSKPETLPALGDLTISEEMTVGQFGTANNISNPLLKEIFNLKAKTDLEKPLNEYGSPDSIKALVNKKMALAAEHATKNWQKIVIKFACWFIFLLTVFLMLRKRKISQTLRKGLLIISLMIFGVALGSDPSPMGTVKDAIHLYGQAKAVFPPRLIALTLFLLIVFIANKYICAWGCQMGTLQDLVFRFNQTSKYKTVLGRQFKLPFALTNTVRIAFLIVFTVIAFGWGLDIIEPIDPFKIYKPAYLGLIGGGFVGMLLILSLFIYRPWCHLLCPFGLVGWLVEKISRVKVSVDYDTCIACEKCAGSCPSTVMGAILKQNKTVIPDCFACYTCAEVCPTD